MKRLQLFRFLGEIAVPEYTQYPRRYNARECSCPYSESEKISVLSRFTLSKSLLEDLFKRFCEAHLQYNEKVLQCIWLDSL